MRLTLAAGHEPVIIECQPRSYCHETGDARVVSLRAPTTLTQFYFPIIITILLSKVTEIVER